MVDSRSDGTFSSARSKCLIIAASPVDAGDSSPFELADAMTAGGWKSVTVVEQDEIECRTCFRVVSRPAEGAEPGHTRELAAAASADDATEPLIQQIDHWARATWKSAAAFWWRGLALAAWATIRIFYRIRSVAAFGWWVLQYPFVRIFWRVVHPTFYPARVIRQWIFWRLQHPALWPFLRHARWIVWNVLQPPTHPFRRLLGRTDRGRGASIDARSILAWLGPDDVVVMGAATAGQLDGLFGVIPELELSGPLPTTLHVRITPSAIAELEKRDDLLGYRLESGCPFEALYIYADGAEDAERAQRRLGLPVHPLNKEPDGRVSLATMVKHFQSYRSEVASGAARPGPSLITRAFGPVVLLVSAFWGRTGSTSIFDAQTRYLISRGFVVVRVFVEHYPHHGNTRTERNATFLRENFARLRPHLAYIAERNDNPWRVRRTKSTDAYLRGSAVNRMLLVFEDAATVAGGQLRWLSGRARLAIVNHLPHVAFTKKLTSAPIIFATHDVYADLLDKHGVPGFVEANPKASREQAMAEELDVCRRVAACVNVSPIDHEYFARGAKRNAFIRPYAAKHELVRRSWLVVAAANQLPARLRHISTFDLMLWGDWHKGNVDGALWFLDEVVAKDARLRDVRVLLVGRVAKGLPDEVTQRSNVYATGFVDHLDDFLVRSKVLVIPDQGGTGTSIKAMEAFASRCCFATTAGGMRGVDTGDSGFRGCADAAELAQDVVALLRSRSLRQQRQVLAGQLYRLNFSREIFNHHWDQLLRDVVPEVPLRTELVASDATAQGNSDQTVGIVPSKGEGLMIATSSGAPRLSVIICTYDRYDVLPDAIDSVLAQNASPGFFELIVVDNSPDQAGAAKFGTRYADDPRIRYDLEPVPGLSNARNKGTALAKAGIVAFMDDDAIADPGWAAAIVGAFDAFGKDAGIVGGRVVPHWVKEKPAWLSNDLVKYLSVIDWGGECRVLESGKWVVGCNIAFDREILLKVGGFSQALGRIGSGLSLLSNEETDVAGKIHAIGKVTIYAPQATVEHVIDPQRLTREWFRRRAAWQAVSDFIRDSKWSSNYARMAGEHLLMTDRDPSRAVPVGFFHDTNQEEVFTRDMGLVYDLVMATLKGGVEYNAPHTDATATDKIKARVRMESRKMPIVRRLLQRFTGVD